MPYADFGDPQTLNLYGFVGGNPASKADPDGHCIPWCAALAGGGILADEAPLVATGPVGLTIIGLTAVGVAGYAAYQHFHSNSGNNTPPPPPPPSGQTGSKSSPAPQSNPAPGTQTGHGDPHAPSDVPNGQTVVRGEQGAIPTSGTYSGAQGATVTEAGKGVPHGTVSATTAGEIRAAGGEVRPRPEPAYPGGPINGQHVDVEGGQEAFGPQQSNPAPKAERIPSAPKPQKQGGGSE